MTENSFCKVVTHLCGALVVKRLAFSMQLSLQFETLTLENQEGLDFCGELSIRE